MALIVFLRGVNVGGRKRFQPTVLAKELEALGVVNVGAAGTFIVTGRCSQTRLRGEFVRRLGFATEIVICQSPDLLALVRRGPFSTQPGSGDFRRFVSVLARRPQRAPVFPFDVPANRDWQVRFIELAWPFALGWWRPSGRSFVDPNGVAEKSFGVSATTRNWNTLVRIASALEGSPGEL